MATNNSRVRAMRISTLGDLNRAKQAGTKTTYTDWQWAVVAEVDGRVAGVVSFNRHDHGAKDGIGWQHMANWSFDSVQEFNEHVDHFAEHAKLGGSKVHEAGWR